MQHSHQHCDVWSTQSAVQPAGEYQALAEHLRHKVQILSVKEAKKLWEPEQELV
jgi:hypothetical protein